MICLIEINECTINGNPCKNGGTCKDGHNKYTCNCTEKYTGHDCDTGNCIYINSESWDNKNHV